MSKHKYLAVDFGAGSGRAIVGTLEKGKIVLDEVHRFPNRLINVHGSLYWDIFYLYDELVTGIRKAVQNGHADIKSIAVDTWGVDYGLITVDDQLLGSPYSYRDSRTDGVLEKAFKIMPKEEMYKLTGNQFMQFNSVFQIFTMVKSKSSILKSADKLLFLPDLFNFLLTGEKKSEYTIASTSQLLNAKQKKWEPEIFSRLKIPQRLMPEIVMPATKIGVLHDSISTSLGLRDTDIIAVGSHDTASAVAAVPNLSNDWIFISSGTWSLIGIEIERPIINQRSLKYNFTNEGGVGGKIRFLRNVMGMWIIQELKKEWEMKGKKYTFGQLNKLAEKADPFKCLIDVDSSEFLNPASMENSIIDFCRKSDQKPPKTKGEFVRIVLESLALKYRFIIEKLNEFSGTELKQINIVGGGSQNTLLNQFTSDATGLKVSTGPVEATAFGNIIVQAIANENIKDLSYGRRIIKKSIHSSVYLPKNIVKWNKAYELFVAKVKSF